MRFVFALLAFTSLLSAGDVRLPPFTKQQLPNGAVVYVIPRLGIPLVQFRIVLRGGFASEPVDQAGLASITAQMLRKGFDSLSADDFSNELDRLGGTFMAASNEDSTTIEAEFLRKDFDRGLALVSGAVLRPSFPEAELRKLISQSTDRIRASKDQPQAAISQYFRAFFYGPQHPYGRVANETSLGRITASSVQAYHKQRYVGRNLIFAVAGDFDAQTATAAIAKTLANLNSGTVSALDTSAKPQPGGRLLLVDKPDATQTYFQIGQPGIRRTDSDRTSVMLLNTLFGGRFTSLLNEALRVNTGLTYGASSNVSIWAEPGPITISTYTKTETTVQAMDLALDVLKKFNGNGISAEQLASAKAYMKGTFPPRTLETSDQIAAAITAIELYGLNRGEVDDLFSRINSLSLVAANNLVKKRYATDNLTFVVLGPADKIRDQVKKYAPQMVEVAIKAPGFNAPGTTSRASQ